MLSSVKQKTVLIVPKIDIFVIEQGFMKKGNNVSICYLKKHLDPFLQTLEALPQNQYDFRYYKSLLVQL